MKRLIGLGLLALVIAACGGSPALNADAGADFEVAMDEAPVFDGCASQGDIVNYSWTIVSAPEGMSDVAGKALRATDTNCSFTLETAMALSDTGVWLIELEVRDAAGNTSTDQVQVKVLA